MTHCREAGDVMIEKSILKSTIRRIKRNIMVTRQKKEMSGVLSSQQGRNKGKAKGLGL